MTKQRQAAPAAPKAEAPQEAASEQPVAQAAPAADAPAEPAAKPTEPAAKAAAEEQSATVKGRVLRACVYGPCDAVVEIPVHQVEALAGVVDTDPAAVAYAESLKS
jgi:hypothetical protein